MTDTTTPEFAVGERIEYLSSGTTWRPGTIGGHAEATGEYLVYKDEAEGWSQLAWVQPSRVRAL